MNTSNRIWTMTHSASSVVTYLMFIYLILCYPLHVLSPTSLFQCCTVIWQINIGNVLFSCSCLSHMWKLSCTAVVHYILDCFIFPLWTVQVYHKIVLGESSETAATLFGCWHAKLSDQSSPSPHFFCSKRTQSSSTMRDYYQHFRCGHFLFIIK